MLAPASRAILGKRKEPYAGIVENMDSHIGRPIDHLKKIGEYENTVVIVFGDPAVEFNLDQIGPKAQRSLPDALRCEPGFPLDVLADLAIPIGGVKVEKYDAKSLTLSQPRARPAFQGSNLVYVVQ